jgi:hypothetical protein
MYDSKRMAPVLQCPGQRQKPQKPRLAHKGWVWKDSRSPQVPPLQLGNNFLVTRQGFWCRRIPNVTPR